MRFKTFYFWFALPMIVVVCWAVVFYGPVSARKKGMERDLAAILSEKANAEREVGAMRARMIREGETKSKVDSMTAGIPRINELPAFMKRIDGMAAAKGVIMSDMENRVSGLDGGGGVVANPSFELRLMGRFLSIGQFLEDMEDLKAFKGIERADLSFENGQYPILRGTFVVEFKARRDQEP